MGDDVDTSGEEGADDPTPSTRRAAIAIGVAIVVAVIVFGVIFPRLVDWNVVFDTLGAVSATDFVVIFGLGLLRYAPAGWIYSIVLPGLSLKNGTRAWVATSGVGSTLPGFDLVLRVGMYRSWGFPLERAMSGMFLSGIVEMSSKLLIAVSAVLLWGLAALDLGAIAIAAIAIAVVGAIAALLAGILHSEDRARRFGDRVQRIAAWAYARTERAAPDDLVERILSVRAEAREVLGRRWPQAFLAALIGQVILYVMLLLSIRAVGIDDSVLSWADILLAYAVTTIVTSIPISPGGVGIAELTLVAMFTALAGRDVADLATAGVIVYRMATWLITIPIGWVVTLHWQSKSGMKMFGSSTPSTSTSPG